MRSAFVFPFAKLESRRQRLGITKAGVATRAGVSLPTVNRIFGGKEPSPTLGNLQAIATSLGLVIQIGASVEIQEPQDAHEFRKARAFSKARRLVGLIQGTMALESQAVDSKTLDQMIEQTAFELLTGPSSRLWND